jgi:hypothetical protein
MDCHRSEGEDPLLWFDDADFDGIDGLAAD